MLRSIVSLSALLTLFLSPGLATAQGEPGVGEVIAEDAPAETGEDAGVSGPAIEAESAGEPAADAEEASSDEQEAAEEEDPFAELIGMTEKQLRKKWGRPASRMQTVFGDEALYYNLSGNVLVVVVMRDGKVFKVRAYQKAG